ncbi:hypothetical protein BSLG_003132 [Batrachochytrium salamandrivorans]|nr:hypothetical protein BSLG_003885 [Batrachochytrium salamandrivorans]KAJ1342209.1 hypothetical protein BSLG_003132 [Batrachochytrium salamandrivorans]
MANPTLPIPTRLSKLLLPISATVRRFSITSSTQSVKVSSDPHALASQSDHKHHDDHHDGHHDDHHDHHHDPTNEPGGPLFGHKKGRKLYMWEPIYYIGIPTDIARAEALKRLAARGEKFDYPLPPHYADN